MSKHQPTKEDLSEMQQGARANKAIDAYLHYINDTKPKGRKPDPAKIQQKIEAEDNLAKKVILVSQLHEALEREEAMAAEESLEQEFIKYALWFSEKHSVRYAAWREMGVQAQILTKAAITP